MFGLAGCALVPVYEGVELSDQETALIKADTSMNLFTRSTDMRIEEIDGIEPSGWATSHRLMPGIHSIKVHCTYMGPIYCNIWVPHTEETRRVVIENIDLKAGHEYIVKGETQSEGACDVLWDICAISVEDITTGEVIQRGEAVYRDRLFILHHYKMEK